MPFFLPLRIYLLRKLLKLWDNNHNLLIPLDMYKKKKILTRQEPGDSHSDGNVLRFSHKFQLTLKLCAFLSQLKRNGPLKIKTTMEVSLHISQNGHHKKNLPTVNAVEGVEKREPSYTVGGNLNWCSHCGEQYGGSLEH